MDKLSCACARLTAILLVFACGTANGQGSETVVEFGGSTVAAVSAAWPTFGSSLADCSLTPVEEPYFVQYLAADSSHGYTFDIAEPIDADTSGVDDTILTLYADSVDADIPCENLVAVGNEVPGEGLQASLDGGRQYALVISGFLGSEDDFRIRITGPPGRSIWLGRVGTDVGQGDGQPIVDSPESAIAEAYRLGSVYPNPLSTAGRFELTVREPQVVRAELIDLLGRRVAVLLDAAVPAQTNQEIAVNATNLPPGIYIVRVIGESFREARPVTVAR